MLSFVLLAVIFCQLVSCVRPEYSDPPGVNVKWGGFKRLDNGGIKIVFKLDGKQSVDAVVPFEGLAFSKTQITLPLTAHVGDAAYQTPLKDPVVLDFVSADKGYTVKSGKLQRIGEPSEVHSLAENKDFLRAIQEIMDAKKVDGPFRGPYLEYNPDFVTAELNRNRETCPGISMDLKIGQKAFKGFLPLDTVTIGENQITFHLSALIGSDQYHTAFEDPVMVEFKSRREGYSVISGTLVKLG